MGRIKLKETGNLKKNFKYKQICQELVGGVTSLQPGIRKGLTCQKYNKRKKVWLSKETPSLEKMLTD